MNFNEELKKRTEEAEHVIRKYLPEESGFAKTMAEAMNYSMTAGGKRLSSDPDQGNLSSVWRERTCSVNPLWRRWR